MVIPCGVEVARLTVQLRKPSPLWWQGWLTEPEGGWWWKDRMLIGLRSLCRGPVGVVRTLGPLSIDQR